MFEEIWVVVRLAPTPKLSQDRNGVIASIGDQRRDVGAGHFGVPAGIVVEMALDANRNRLQMPGKTRLIFDESYTRRIPAYRNCSSERRSNRPRGISRSGTRALCARYEGRVIVGHQRGCIGASRRARRLDQTGDGASETRSYSHFASRLAVSGTPPAERVESIVRVRIGTRQPFVEQQRQPALIRQIGCERQRMIRIHSLIHLRPVENGIFRRAARPRSTAGSFSHVLASHANGLAHAFFQSRQALWVICDGSGVARAPVSRRNHEVQSVAAPRAKRTSSQRRPTRFSWCRARPTGEHMMLIGLGEPFMDRKIVASALRTSLLSTNGTFLDERWPTVYSTHACSTSR